MSIKTTITEIKNIRAGNNDLWMEILQIAIEADPIRTSKVLSRIKQNDTQVTEKTLELLKEAVAEEPLPHHQV